MLASLSGIYDTLADQYEQGDGINDFFFLPLVKYYCASHARSALEIACGVGRTATEIAKSVDCVWGIDLSQKMIGYARQRSAGAVRPPVFVQGDVLAYDFGYRTFDYVYGVYCMAYFDVAALLDKLIPLVAPGGRLFAINGLRGPGESTFRILDLAQQYVSYRRFFRQRGLPIDTAGWLAHRLRRRAFLMSKDWKRAENWRRAYREAKHPPSWADQFRARLPDARIEQITPRLACALWDRQPNS